MHYEFESANHIDDYLKAIKGVEEFFVKEDTENGIQIINYMFNSPTTFPDTRGLVGEELRLAVLRRDCRGIKFDLNGNLIGRPLHKFFNVGERPETQINEVDWTQPHIILEKLDGSFIHPIRLHTGEIEWCTKMGITDVALPVKEFVKKNPKYNDFAIYAIDRNLTLIFEWCSRKQRIVIDYPQDQLVLIAIRDNFTGKYMQY